MNDAEKLMKKKLVYKAEMDKILPKEKSRALWMQATEKLEEIMNSHTSVPKGVRMHTGKVFSAAAVYLTLKDEIGQEKAYSVMENAAVQICAGIEPKLAGLMRLPGMKSLFISIWNPMTKKIFGPQWVFKIRNGVLR